MLQAPNFAGEWFDFHSLRHRFRIDLARSGIHPKVAQTLARHSTVSLTLDRYSHASVCDLAGTLAGLLAVTATRGVLAATGTDDAFPVAGSTLP